MDQFLGEKKQKYVTGARLGAQRITGLVHCHFDTCQNQPADGTTRSDENSVLTKALSAAAF